MLSQEAELALGRLNEGAIMNSIHTTARELINEGLAQDEWGRLTLTEEGRKRARRTRGSYANFAIDLPDIHEMAPYDPAKYPMGPPPPPPPRPEPEPVVVRPTTNYDRALQAAGVASGKTGVWPETEWVHAFMDAWIIGEQNEQ